MLSKPPSATAPPGGSRGLAGKSARSGGVRWSRTPPAEPARPVRTGLGRRPGPQRPAFPRVLAPTHRTLALALSALLVLPSVASASKKSRGVASVSTSASQGAATPDSVLAELKEGNRRFVAGRSTRYDWLGQTAATASGQHPKAIVLGCLDSRVIPEVAFDEGIGDLFVGRVAGNFENTDQLGSLEFGTAVAGAKLIVVLGHGSCGAVKGAIDQAQLGNLTAMLGEIEPAIEDVEVGSQGRTSKDAGSVARVVEANVRRTVADITKRSPVLAERVASGDLRVVGGVYDLGTGVVRWLD